MRQRTAYDQRPPGWADERIPAGYVSKAHAATLLGVSTVTIDRWSRPGPEIRDGRLIMPKLTRYQATGGYPYTLFNRSEIMELKRSKTRAK